MEYLHTALRDVAAGVPAPTQHESVWKVGATPTDLLLPPPPSDGVLELPLFTLNPRQFQFYTYVGVGSPPQYTRVVFDTTTSDISILAYSQPRHESYNHNKSSTYIADDTVVTTRIPASTDLAVGNLSQDNVFLGGEATLHSQFFTEVLESPAATAFFDTTDADGWIGLARAHDQQSYPVPSVIHALIEQKLIRNAIVGIHLNPLATGLVTIGAVNDQLFHGNLTYINVSNHHHDDWGHHHSHWSFHVDAVWIDSHLAPPPPPPPLPPLHHRHHQHSIAVIDSVLPVIVAPPHIADAVNAALGQQQQSDRVLCNDANGAVPLNLTLVFNGHPFALQREDLVAKALSGAGCVSLLVAAPPPPPSPHQPEQFYPHAWRLGAPFMQAYYTALDFNGSRVGFAPSKRSVPPAFSAYDTVWLLLLGVVVVLIGRSLGRKDREEAVK